jgi:thiol-disulfide isomerase/thioredoxin
MKKYIIPLVLLLAEMSTFAQPRSSGDKLPPWKFSALFNYPSSSINLDDYKGKIVLLNFWQAGCSNNYKILPLLADWQKKFRKDVQVILVSEEPDAKLNSVFVKRNKLKELGLPFAQKDTAFEKLFPHKSAPHIVIVGRNGRIAGVTTLPYLNEKNLVSLISGRPVSFPPPVNDAPVDKNTPFAYSHIITGNLLYNSILTGYAKQVGSEVSINTLPDYRSRLFITNVDVKQLYLFAYGDQININPFEEPVRLKWEVGDASKYNAVAGEPGSEKKLYCYELILPDSPRSKTNDQLINYMKSDLTRYFHLEAHVEKRTTKCYVLKPLSSVAAETKISAGSAYIQEWIDSLEFSQVTGETVGDYLQQFLLKDLPLVYENKEKRFYSFSIGKSYPGLESLRRDLESKGLALTIEERETSFLIIKETRSDQPR